MGGTKGIVSFFMRLSRLVRIGYIDDTKHVEDLSVAIVAVFSFGSVFKLRIDSLHRHRERREVLVTYFLTPVFEEPAKSTKLPVIRNFTEPIKLGVLVFVIWCESSAQE